MSNLISGSGLNAEYIASAHWINKLSKLGIVIEIRERSHLPRSCDSYADRIDIPIEPVIKQNIELVDFADEAVQYDFLSYELMDMQPEWFNWFQNYVDVLTYIMSHYVKGITPGFLFDPRFRIHLSRLSCRDRLGDIVPVTLMYWDPYETPSPDEKPGKVGERRGWALIYCPPEVCLGRELITFFQVNWYSDVWFDNPLRKERNDQDYGSQSESDPSDESGGDFTSFFG